MKRTYQQPEIELMRLSNQVAVATSSSVDNDIPDNWEL